MVSPRGRLAVLSLLFLAWIGWLAYLVVKTRDPVVLSRPQFLVANHVSIVRIGEKDGKPDPDVEVLEALKPADAATKRITLAELPFLDAKHGWRGPGDYLIALTVSLKNAPHITPIPASPGYVPRFMTVELRRVNGPADKAAETILPFAGWSREEFDRRVQNLPVMLRANVPPEEAIAFAKAIGPSAIVSLTEADLRIYPATADVRRQYESLVAPE